MANYVNIQFALEPPSSGFINVADSAASSWITHARQVEVGLYPPVTLSGATDFKIWGIDAVAAEEDASWQPFVTTYSGVLDNTDEEQIVNVRFRNDSLVESDIITASGIFYQFTQPTNNSSVNWVGLTDEITQVAKLVNTTDKIEIEFSKADVPHLKFHNREFDGLTIGGEVISVDPNSQIGLMINHQLDAKVVAKKIFDDNKIPFIRVDTGSGFKTLTKYDGSPRTDLFGEYLNKIDNYFYSSKDKELIFDINSFSDYGFCTISKVEFTNNSQTGGYITKDIVLEVKVIDTNGEGVEGAPVTFSGFGDDIGVFVANPVYTNSSGIAQATLSLDALGSAVYDAYVDDFHTLDTQLTWCIDIPANLSRSLLTQYEQIKQTAVYDDSIVNANISEVAEPDHTTASGNSDDVLEHDTNVLRTILKQIKGTVNWYDSLGNCFDPTNTDIISTENKVLNISSLKNNTLDSKTIIIPIESDNSGLYFTVSGTDEGFLFNTSMKYADVSDRTGLPIFSSISGTYFDETGIDEVCTIDLINPDTGAEFTDSSGNIIYAKFHDGVDYNGLGNGVDVYIKFYANDLPYTWTNDDPTSIMMIFPQRKVMSDVTEYEWTRTDFVNGFEGDTVIVDDISNLWLFVGAIDDESMPLWDNSSDYYLLKDSPITLKAALDVINDGFGNFSFTEQNYITSGESITDILDDLDIALKSISSSLGSGVGEKVIETLYNDVLVGEVHYLPSGYTYTPDYTSGREGRNMDLFVNGQLLKPSTGIGGINWDGDYQEVSTSGIAFAHDIYMHTNITYIIRQ